MSYKKSYKKFYKKSYKKDVSVPKTGIHVVWTAC